MNAFTMLGKAVTSLSRFIALFSEATTGMRMEQRPGDRPSPKLAQHDDVRLGGERILPSDHACAGMWHTQLNPGGRGSEFRPMQEVVPADLVCDRLPCALLQPCMRPRPVLLCWAACRSKTVPSPGRGIRGWALSLYLWSRGASCGFCAFSCGCFG